MGICVSVLHECNPVKDFFTAKEVVIKRGSGK